MREMKRSMMKNDEATSNAIVTASTNCPRSSNCGGESAMPRKHSLLACSTCVPSDWQRHSTTRHGQHTMADDSAYERRTELQRAVESATAQP